jgi:hypothetical protein
MLRMQLFYKLLFKLPLGGAPRQPFVPELNTFAFCHMQHEISKKGARSKWTLTGPSGLISYLGCCSERNV